MTGVIYTGLVLLYEHRLVRPDDLSQVNRAFFQANVLISLGMLFFVVLEVLL